MSERVLQVLLCRIFFNSACYTARTLKFCFIMILMWYFFCFDVYIFEMGTVLLVQFSRSAKEPNRFKKKWQSSGCSQLMFCRFPFYKSKVVVVLKKPKLFFLGKISCCSWLFDLVLMPKSEQDNSFKQQIFFKFQRPPVLLYTVWS